MAHSNNYQRESFGYIVVCSLLFSSAFLMFFCPEFVQSALRGRIELSLISKGIEARIKEIQSLLDQSAPLRQPTLKSVDRLFGSAQKLGPGAIAIGQAEGTLKADGKPTWAYYGHRDPANRVTNKGFASWQASPVKDAKEADQKAIHRIRTQCVPHTVKSFQRHGVTLTPRLLVESCDIWIQAPRAAVDFAPNLKYCQRRGKPEDEVILCARLKNYVNPATGRLEVASIFRPPGALKKDQSRRMNAIASTLQRFQVPAWLPMK